MAAAAEGSSPAGSAALTLRPAVAADAPAAAGLILSSMGRFGEVLLGFGDESKARGVLERWFPRAGHRFSSRFATLAELDGELAGLLLGFPASDLWRLELGLAPVLRLAYSPGELLHFISGNLALLRLKEAERGDWLVAHVATEPRFRQHGVARCLMAEAEALARRAGCKRCALLVELDNEPARRLYASLGYQAMGEQRWPRLEAMGSPGFARMVKPLVEGPAG
jgi:ribosomal protein S18 acetylase RimI-like enzyme